MDLYRACEKLVDWIEDRLVSAGRGDREMELDVEPGGKFWLGRLAPEDAVVSSGLGERGERLDPCAVGMRMKPIGTGPWHFRASVGTRTWLRDGSGVWKKSSPLAMTIDICVDPDVPAEEFGEALLSQGLAEICGVPGLSACIRVECDRTPDGNSELTVLLVNKSPSDSNRKTIHDSNLYECEVKISGLAVQPFLLESLPDSFRYDRRVAAYGVNCGVEELRDGTLVTRDTITADRYRPKYWSVSEEQPDFRFDALSEDPLPTARALEAAMRRWGDSAWSDNALEARARRDRWDNAMLGQAKKGAEDFGLELVRIRQGIGFLEEDQTLLHAFRLMNRAMSISSKGRGYDRWRPFQFGFLLTNLGCIVNPESEREIADIVWFATGGGKTETYLGLLITAALYDRLTDKQCGVTAWSRFPLRMLSLQQTQRFADAMAAAELVRREAAIPGSPFSVGFFVGQGATPNRIEPEAKPGDFDPYDDEAPKSYQVLLRCPFCHESGIGMAFDHRYWRLEHRCANVACPWPEDGLPFYIVDEEIYRFLPTVIVGTLDKAASISMQAAMRGLVAAPLGKCSEEGHGYVYAPRSKRPNGCLVPGCRGRVKTLDMEAHRYGPSFRLQDELHLLRDSLGAVDSHYEGLYDDLENELCGRKPKILASSATLTGYERQVDILYRRKARVFPVQGPSAKEGFWTSDSSDLMRRFVAVAPRGLTTEYAVDRLLTELQAAIRQLATDPEKVCAEIGVDPVFAGDLVSLYGTDVVYGNTIRDLEAVMRSIETQVNVGSVVNSAALTGRTHFDEVRHTLERLERPERIFEDRIHVVAASSMMSHGVDIDRLNVMVMLGLPLSTAEFLQATARAGRKWPSLVLVVHKIARERDAGIFRSFKKFIEQGDRFVEPIPVTRRSRRVLERTIAGLEFARILAIHEARSSSSLWMVSSLRERFISDSFGRNEEVEAIARMLGLEGALDEPLKRDIISWFDRFFGNLENPGGTFKFINDLSPTGKPMLSLRDVEEQAPVIGSRLQ
jgi:hypothetical protein